MTLEEKIALLLPKKKVCEGCGCSYSDEELKSCGSVSCCPDGDTWEHIYNTGIDQCATNLKQAFEEGKICFVPSVEDIAQAAYHQSQVIDKQDVFRIKWDEMTDIWKKPWINMAKAILSLLTKGKDNAK